MRWCNVRSAGSGAQRLKTDLWPWGSLTVGSWVEWFMRINPSSDTYIYWLAVIKLVCVFKKVYWYSFYERILKKLCLLQIKPDERVLITERGLLIRWLHLSDAGSYFCTSQEHSFTRNLLHLSLHVLDRGQLHGHHSAIRESSENPTVTEPRQRYKDYLRLLSGHARSLDEYCETLWHREKKQKQKGKWKHVQEFRKSRNRRHH